MEEFMMMYRIWNLENQINLGMWYLFWLYLPVRIGGSMLLIFYRIMESDT